MRGLRGLFPTARLEFVAASLGILLGILFFASDSLAQAPAAAPAGPASGPPAWMSYVPFLFVIVVMMFLSNRQRVSAQKKQEEVITGLKRGDQVLTNGGILGRVEGVAETFLTLEIADGVRVKILKTQIAGPANLEAKT